MIREAALAVEELEVRQLPAPTIALPDGSLVLILLPARVLVLPPLIPPVFPSALPRPAAAPARLPAAAYSGPTTVIRQLGPLVATRFSFIPAEHEADDDL
jgi:hypothetical protein